MTLRSIVCALLLFVPAVGVRAAFSPEKLELIDRLFQGELAALSPDGKRLAYTKYDEGKLWLNMVDFDRRTQRAIPLDAPKGRSGEIPRLKYLRWATSERIVLASAGGAIMAMDPDGRNAVRLWEADDNGLVHTMFLQREPYFIVPQPPRILPPLAGDSGHLLFESVATIGAESFANPYLVDVRSNTSELANADSYLNYQVALYGRGDMLLWPPLPRGRASLYSLDAGINGSPFEVRMRMELDLMFDPVDPQNLMPETGAAVDRDSSFNGRMLYDRTGRPRLLYTMDTGGGARDFRYIAPGEPAFEPGIPKPTLDKVLGQPKAREFTLSARNYFGERSYPLAFDFDPDILYYASNVGRDTYGIYSLNLKTKARTEILPGLPGVDLASGDPEETDDILVFDEHAKKLIGVRYQTLRPRTAWLDPEFGQLQAMLDRSYPRYGVEILSWDDDRQRFLFRISSEDDPGGLLVYHRKEDRLEQVVSRTPWLADTTLNPASSFLFTTPSGVQLSGYLTMPTKTKIDPPPLMIYLQASLWDRAEPGFNRETEMLADMGVVVMRLNYRGSPGFGRKHLTAIQDGIDTVPAEDLIAAVNWLNEHAKIDLKRVMVMGESLGGYIALQALRLHPDIFRCGISLNAPTNLTAWSGLQPVKATTSMFRNGSVEAGGTVDLRSEVRKAFVNTIKKGSNSATPSPGATKPAILVIESSNSTETTPISSFLAAIGLGARGTDVSRLEISGDFQGGTHATRVKVFERIEEFLNENLYEFRSSIGKLKVIDPPDTEKKP